MNAETGRRNNDKGTPLEWLMAAIGGLLVAGALGYLAYSAMASDGRPPVIAVLVESVERAGDIYVVSFRAENTGDHTASDVTIEGTLRRNGRTVEKAEVTLNFVPEGSVRRGGLYFSQEPGPEELELKALGYAEP